MRYVALISTIVLCSSLAALAAEPPVTGSAAPVDSAPSMSAAKPTLNADTTLIVVIGAAGEPQYGEMFEQWVKSWKKAGAEGGAKTTVIGQDPPSEQTDRGRLKQAIEQATHGKGALWIVLLGHGTYDGRQARVCLRGPDVTDSDLVTWLEPVTRPLVVINATAASGPTMTRLAGKNRIILTATKSAKENSFAHIGEFLSKAVIDPATDLDKDGQISLLELYLSSAKQVKQFYSNQQRLMTEHALLDDNGDGLGTPADWFEGVRPVKTPLGGDSADGYLTQQISLIPSAAEKKMPAELLARRNQLELEIFKLRDSQANMPEDKYFEQLEKLCIELATVYDEAEKSGVPIPKGPDAAATATPIESGLFNGPKGEQREP